MIKLKKLKTKKSISFIILSVLIIGVVIGVIINMINQTSSKIELQTNYGNIVIELYKEEMPITAGNFENLVKKGFYDNTIFHRIINGFMIQGGDPLGTGTGGPGYTIKDEFTNTNLDNNLRGTISMANAGPNTGGSQFFINLVDNTYLDGRHPVFGKIIQGMEIVDKIAQVKTDSNDKPIQAVIIKQARIVK